MTTAVTDTADVVGTDSVAGAGLRCAGLLADDPEPLLAAVRAYARSPRPLALTCGEAAVALVRRGR